MSQKIVCYKCEAKLEISDEVKPLSKINCNMCDATITVPYVIGDMVIESQISETEYYTTYKAYQVSNNDNLIVRIAENDQPVDVQEKAIDQLNLVNANEGNELLITQLDKKILFVRPNYKQSLSSYLKAKRPTAENAYRTILTVTKQLNATAKESLFLKDLSLENIFIDDSGKIIITDLSLEWTFKFPSAKYKAEMKDGLKAYKTLVFEILTGKKLSDDLKEVKLDLRDASPQDLDDFLSELVRKNSIFQNFEDCLKILKKVDLKGTQESSKPSEVNQEKETENNNQPKKKEVQTSKLKSKNILKRNRRKTSVGLPALLMVAAFIGVTLFILKQTAFFGETQEVKVVKKAPEVKKKKTKPKKEAEPVKIVEFREITPIVKVEESVDMKGQISLLSFHEIMESKCVSCHGAEGKEVEGKFNLVKLMASKGVHNKHWAAIYKQIQNGDMPPEDETPLTEDEKLVVLAELRQMTSQTEVARKTRALTPDEIKNTLVDIFQIDEDTYNPFTPLYANYDQDDFYSTQKSVITPYYLDDLYETLHDALESYVALNPVTKPLNQSADFPNRVHLLEKHGSKSDLRWGRGDIDFVQTTFKNLDPPEESGRKKVRNRDEVGPDSAIEDGLAKLSLPPGTYELSFDAQALKLGAKINEKKYGKAISDVFKRLSEKHDYSLPVEFFIHPPGQNDPHARRKFVTTVDIESSEMSRYTVKFTLDRRNGIGFRFPIGLMPSDGRMAKMLANHRVQGRPVERKDIEEMYKKFMRTPKYDFPQVRFQNVKIAGPFDVKVSPYSVADDERLNNITIRKKFRTLHNENLIQMNMSYDYIFDKFRGRQIEREESYRNSLVAFFLSTEFLTLNYDTKDRRKHARMLSYVFHKSTPSQDLNEQFEKAIKSKDTSEFTEWLVSHPNFDRYIESFTKQWLHLSNVNEAMPDMKNFREFYNNNLMDSYTEEAKQFLLYLFRENRPVKEIVAADYSIINNDLISFYGGGKRHQEDGFKKHTFSNKSRGGILASGAFLTATGNGVEQLPIKRAEWILTNLLDSHLPPPPDDIDLGKFQQDLSAPLHKKLEAHSENAACYSCHKKIDPLAIMMNGFNTIGGIDYKGRSNKVKLNDVIIRNFTEFKQYIGSQEEAIARSFVKSILRYSLGRDLYVQDAEALDKIITENKKDNFPVKNLMKSVMKYYFF